MLFNGGAFGLKWLAGAGPETFLISRVANRYT
jgi:hypothetical protein